MAALSKRQKKYIDQAIRRAEQQFNKWTKYERQYAEAIKGEAPKLNLPTRGEVYKKVEESGTNEYAKLVREMATIDVYQPPTAKEFEEKYKITSTGGVKSFKFGRGIDLIKKAYKTYETDVREHPKEAALHSLRNLYKDIEERTNKRYSETLSEQRIREDRQYLKSLANMLRKELEPVSPELYELMLKKLGVKAIEGVYTGKSGDFKVTSKISSRADVIASLKDEADAAIAAGKLARATAKALAGKKVSGLAEIINYTELKEILTILVGALDIDLSATYDGMTVADISELVMKRKMGTY